MKILSWNFRGFVRPATICSLRILCRLNRPNVLFLCETKVNFFEAQNPLSRIGFPFFVQVPAVGTKEGLVLAWKVGFDLEPIRLSPHQISCIIYSTPLQTLGYSLAFMPPLTLELTFGPQWMPLEIALAALGF